MPSSRQDSNLASARFNISERELGESFVDRLNDTADFIEVETPTDQAEAILERLRLENCESVE